MNNCISKNRTVLHVAASSTKEIWFISGTKPGLNGVIWTHGISKSQLKDISDKYSYSNCNIAIMNSSNYFDDDVSYVITTRNARQELVFSYSENISETILGSILDLKNEKELISKINIGLGFNNKGYFISYSNGWAAKLHDLGSHCEQEIKLHGAVHEVAVSSDGAWVVIRDRHFAASNGVSDELTTHLKRCFANHRDSYNQRNREIEEFHDKKRKDEEEVNNRKREEEEEIKRKKEEDQQLNIEKNRQIQYREDEETKIAQLERITRQLQEQIRKQQEEHRREKEFEEMNFKKRQVETLEHEINELHQKVKMKKVEYLRLGRETGANISSHNSSSSLPQCIVCDNAIINIVLLPCNHVCLCETCCNLLLSHQSSRNCPVCRGVVASHHKVFLSGYGLQ